MTCIAQRKRYVHPDNSYVPDQINRSLGSSGLDNARVAIDRLLIFQFVAVREIQAE